MTAHTPTTPASPTTIATADGYRLTVTSREGDHVTVTDSHGEVMTLPEWAWRTRCRQACEAGAYAY